METSLRSVDLSPAGNVCDPWLSGLGDVTKFWAADASLGATSGAGGSVLWDETRPGAARVADKSFGQTHTHQPPPNPIKAEARESRVNSTLFICL